MSDIATIEPGIMIVQHLKTGRGRASIPARVIKVDGVRLLVQPAGHKHTEWAKTKDCKPWKKGNHNRRKG